MPRREKLLEMLQLDPQDPFLHYALGLDYANAGEVEAGLSELQLTLQHDARYVAAYYQLGRLRAEQRDLTGAREILKQGAVVARQIGDSHAEGEITELLNSLG